MKIEKKLEDEKEEERKVQEKLLREAEKIKK